MKKREADFGTLFRHWWRRHPMRGTFEHKQTRTSSIPFSCVEQAQLDSAMANKSSTGNLIRIQSGTIGAGDYVGLVRDPAYIVIKYPRHFEIIDVETFILEKSRSKTKSLTSARAKEISIISVITKS